MDQTEMSSNKRCCICDDDSTDDRADSVTLTKKRIDTIKKASKQRKDDLHRRNFKVLSIVHSSCYNRYTHHRNIENAIKNIAKSKASSSQPRRSKSSSEYEYDKLCIFCDSDASDDFITKQNRKPYNKRIVVRKITKNETITNIIAVANKIKSEKSSSVAAIVSVVDLEKVTPRYHDSCFNTFYKSTYVAHPKETISSPAVKYVVDYLNRNSDECQFSLANILEGYTGPQVTLLWLCKRLEENLKDNIIIHHPHSANPILIYKGKNFEKLSDAWYDNRSKDERQEKIRIVLKAVDVIYEDIRSQVYEDVEYYPSSYNFMETAEQDIAPLLQLFTHELILREKISKEKEKWKKKATFMSHSITAAVRPRSFTSQALLSVASIVHCKTGSKDIVEMLSNIGCAASYHENHKLVTSILKNKKKIIIGKGPSGQHIVDNADHQIDSTYGSKTFHVMGMIACVNEEQIVHQDERIPKLKNVPKASEIGELGTIPLLSYEKERPAGLSFIIVEDISKLNNISYKSQISGRDLLWLYSKCKYPITTSGWNGFMETITDHLPFKKTRVIFLPFINANPMNYDTIYTSLILAVDRSVEMGLSRAVVTADQPIFWRMHDIISSSPGNKKLQMVTVREGGFHALLSFLGTIGFVMQNSGLYDLLRTVYGENTAKKILEGKDYNKCMRAHSLVHLALGKKILEKTNFYKEERDQFEKLLKELHSEETLNKLDSASFAKTAKKFDECLDKLRENGPTAKLWAQYFDMINIAKNFIDADRCGDWQRHLDFTQRMIPYFHASGHYLYAKTAHLYIQDMLRLQTTMTPEEFHEFAELGCFTIKRSDKYRCGVSSDLAIEQTLNRCMHCTGSGICHGRGTTDSVWACWAVAAPRLLEIHESFLNWLDMSFNSNSLQHKDSAEARMKKDSEDLQKMEDWLSAHDPFPTTEKIICISTGFVGDKSVNCYDALEVGLECMQKIVGQTMQQIKFKRSDRVTPIGCKAAVKSENLKSLNPDDILRRYLLINRGSTEKLEKGFACELAPYPVTLFDVNGMRKTDKSKLYSFFEHIEEKPDFSDCMYVIDGGFLIHRVVWKQGASYGEIIQQVINYVRHHYKGDCTVVFDGYPSDATSKSTKCVERMRRAATASAPEIMFEENMSAIQQRKFLSNEKNKIRFISFLKEQFESEGFFVKQAEEDADVLIVDTAINYATSYKKVVIVGQDIDLLVLLTDKATKTESSSSSKIYFMKQMQGKNDPRIYTCDSFKFSHLKSLLLFMHSFTGCDTTSAIFNMGKHKLIHVLNKNKPIVHNVIKQLECFNKTNVTVEELSSAGESVVRILYGENKDATNNSANDETSYNKFRFNCFTKSSINKTFNLAELPPTQEALKLHCLRVYYQICLWNNDNEKAAEDFGWQRTENGLIPMATTAPMIPPELESVISCKCKKGCNKRCSCKKAGVPCTILCKTCEGTNCSNVAPNSISNINESSEDSNDFQSLLDESDNTEETQDLSTVVTGSELLHPYEESNDPTFAMVVDDDENSNDSEDDLNPPVSKKIRRKM